MTGLTDVRDRTLTMLRALGVELDRKQMRTVEKYVRWVAGMDSAAGVASCAATSAATKRPTTKVG